MISLSIIGVIIIAILIVFSFSTDDSDEEIGQ